MAYNNRGISHSRCHVHQGLASALFSSEDSRSGTEDKEEELANVLKASAQISLAQTSHTVKPDNGMGKYNHPRGALASLLEIGEVM